MYIYLATWTLRDDEPGSRDDLGVCRVKGLVPAMTGPVLLVLEHFRRPLGVSVNVQ